MAVFGSELDGKEYIYKEPGITPLPEVCNRFRELYISRFGQGKVEMIMDSREVRTASPEVLTRDDN